MKSVEVGTPLKTRTALSLINMLRSGSQESPEICWSEKLTEVAFWARKTVFLI